MLSSSGSPEGPAKVWNNHLLQSSMKVLTPSWFLPHRHHSLSLTAATWLNLIGSHPKTALTHGGSYWYFYGLTCGRTLCSPGVCVKDTAPTALQLLKTHHKAIAIVVHTATNDFCQPVNFKQDFVHLVDNQWATGKSSVSSPVHCCEV